MNKINFKQRIDYMLKILSFLSSGLLTGLILSVPIGPANILCLEKTLKSGSFAGFMTGAGATFGDFLFVIAAITGLVVVGDINLDNTYLARTIGVVFLLVFGCLSILKGYSDFKDTHKSLFAIDNNTRHRKHTKMALSGFFSSFVLTVTNPLTPVGVVSAVATVGLGGGIFNQDLRLSIIFFASGILVGSLGWWLCLTMIAKKCAKKITSRSLSWISFAGGILMFSMAIYIFLV